jgi:glycosyltransferase involved in cell wall biosynthesis
LTYPFVLSWSFVEAMAAGCLIVGSATPPVLEFLRDGENGLVVDFFDTSALCNRIAEALDHPDRCARMRAAARRTAVELLDLNTRILPRWMQLFDTLVSRRLPAAVPSDATFTVSNGGEFYGPHTARLDS